jgi:hypothetical protein
MQNKMEPQKLNMQIDPKEEGGNYANIVTVLHTENEFLLDFGMFLPGKNVIRISSRIIMTPRTAKQLLMVLSHNVNNYEKSFGEIKLPQMPTKLPGQYPEIPQ